MPSRSARSPMNPKATTTVVWNGGWWEPQKETEAANAFADAGIDVIAEQVDSPITMRRRRREARHLHHRQGRRHPRPRAEVLAHRRVLELGADDGRSRSSRSKPAHGRRPTCAATLPAATSVLDPFGPAVPERCARDVLEAKDEINAGKKVDLGRSDRQAGRHGGRSGRPEAVDAADRDHGLSASRASSAPRSNASGALDRVRRDRHERRPPNRRSRRDGRQSGPGVAGHA